MHAPDEILGILGKVKDLPSLPQVVNHVLDVMDDARSSVKDVAHAMEEDPALTAKVLRVANSAYYAPRSEITSVSYAIARMGLGEVRNLIITTGVVSSMKGRKLGNLNYEDYWRHCLSVAIVARVVNDHAPLAPKYLKATENPYFVAGLLHDIGILILDQNVSSVYSEVLNHAMDSGRPLAEVEQGILGSDHQEVGGFICNKWHLPQLVGLTARFHHAPEKAAAEDQVFVSVIHVADAVCVKSGAGRFLGHAAEVIQPFAMSALGLGEADIDAIVANVDSALEKSDMLRLVLQD